MKALILFVAAAIFTIAVSSFTNDKELVVTSTSFTNNGMIPVRYSCEGDDINPPLHIEQIPAGVRTLAVIVHDPDAPGKAGFTHWVVWNIGTDGNIPEGYHDAEQGMNGAEKNGYKGMCPPSGIHHYHFKVYALDAKLNLDQNTDKTTLENAMRGHILAQGEIIGLFQATKEGAVK